MANTQGPLGLRFGTSISCFSWSMRSSHPIGSDPPPLCSLGSAAKPIISQLENFVNWKMSFRSLASFEVVSSSWPWGRLDWGLWFRSKTKLLLFRSSIFVLILQPNRFVQDYEYLLNVISPTRLLCYLAYAFVCPWLCRWPEASCRLWARRQCVWATHDPGSRPVCTVWCCTRTTPSRLNVDVEQWKPWIENVFFQLVSCARRSPVKPKSCVIPCSLLCGFLS